MVPVDCVHAIPGKGLEGDRYANPTRTFSGQRGSGQEVTLIEIEALDAVKRDYGIDLGANRCRRNIITRGLALNHLVGREFKVGEVVLQGTILAEPCRHLEKLTQPGVQKALLHRGGLRARVIAGGLIRAGETVAAL
jgi:MOSC domain-containing protein YiiM